MSGGADVDAGERRARRLGALALFAGTLALWLRVAWNDFVSYDVDVYVLENPWVKDGFSWAGVRWAFTGALSANWHPLTWLSHMLDCQLWGLAPAGHHLTNAVLHAANAALLFLALERLSRAWRPSLAAAVLFAVHPLRVESVAWTAERKDVLAGLFWMLALLAYARHVEAPSRRRMLAVAGALALGLMAKSMLVTLPFLLLVLDRWPLGRWAAACGMQEGPRRLVLEKGLLFPLVAASCIVTWAVQAGHGAAGSLRFLPLVPRVENALVATVTYLGKAFWPSGLACFYPHPAILHPDASRLLPALAAAVLLAALTAGALRVGRAAPWVTAGWLWFLGALVPVIGLVQVGEQAWADRYFYLPGAGLGIAVAFGARELVARAGVPARAAAAALALATLALAALTWRQIGFWRDSDTLFGRAIEATDDNYQAHYALGVLMSRRREFEPAVGELRTALSILPTHVESHVSLGYALEQLGNPRGAIEEYQRALLLWPRHVEASYRLGVALAKDERFAEAVERYEAVLREDPRHRDARANLGLALARLGRVPEAVEWLEASVALDPENAEALYVLALLELGAGRIEAAEAHLRATVRLRPRHADAHANLGALLASQGRVDEARAELEAALAAAPDHPQARRALEQLGRRRP